MREPAEQPPSEPASDPKNGNIVSLAEWMGTSSRRPTTSPPAPLRFDLPGDARRGRARAGGARPAPTISIVSEQTSMSLGLATSRAGCQALARGLLPGSTRGHGPLSESEVSATR